MEEPRVIFRFSLLSIFVAALSQVAAPGLIATYSGKDQQITAVSPSPAFVLKENESIHPQLPVQFTARYVGLIKIIRAGQYKFVADAEIVIDKQRVGDQEIKLDEGDHPISIEFTRKTGPARLLVQWQSDQFPLEPIPSSALFHSENPTEISKGEQIARGRLLTQELNCVGCHNAKSDSMMGRRGPDLSQIGSRAARGWGYKGLANPQLFRAHAATPAFLTR